MQVLEDVMISIAICDDELAILGELGKKITNYMIKMQIDYTLTKYVRGEQLLYCNQDYDIVLLDIKMNGINGIETAKKLRIQGKDCYLIFITALKEYVFDAFEVSAVNYLVKPIKNEKLYTTLDKIISRITAESDKFLTISNGQEFKRIKLNDIMYCEASNHNIFVYTINGIENYKCKIEHLETELNEKFFRCHRSYLLNFKYVQSYKDGFALLSSGEKIPVAKRRQQEFIKALLLYQRKEVR